MGMQFLFAAYAAVWVVLGFYLVRIFLRQGKLLRELERLRKEVKDSRSDKPKDS